MFHSKLFVVLVLPAVLCAAIWAQDKPAAPDTPKLTDPVMLKLKSAHDDLITTQLQESLMREQYTALVNKEQTQRGALTKLLETAVKDSNLDESKYAVNSDTFELTPKTPSKK